MGKAVDYTGRTVCGLEVGDRTEETASNPLSSSKWHVFCPNCKGKYIKGYESFRNLRGCSNRNCHPERKNESTRFLNLKNAGQR